MSEARPNPDTLLARVKEQEARQQRGKLKVFFGAAAGVGKTYAMLEAAREQRADGVDVVVGWVETHGRPETDALLAGLEVLPARTVDYRGALLREFDLDAALARRPTLLLVDELAHTNAPGCRHAKRWQAVLELLDAGISVYTTMNVQHLESLNDVIAKITGVVVRETVPDSVLDQADEIALVDLSPEDLLQRLRDGKVYVPQLAEEAIRSFFRKGNLIALRELALRSTADRVDAAMRDYMRDHAIRQTWPVAERLLVCIGPSPSSARLVRAGKRMAERLGAPWIVGYVETPAQLRLPAEARDRVIQTLRLAEQLGAETVMRSGQRMSDEILALAQERNVSKIVVGKPSRSFWARLFLGSIVDTLVAGSGDIDVYVISGAGDGVSIAVTPERRRVTDWPMYGLAVAVVASITALEWALFPYFEMSNLVMLYLLGVVVVAMRAGRGPSAFAAVLSVVAFDFCFVPPYFTFAVADSQDIVTFAVMLVVGLVISGLTVRMRAEAERARERERRTGALYAMSRELANTRGTRELLDIAVRHIAEVFRVRLAVLLPDATGRLQAQPDLPAVFEVDASERAVGHWVYEYSRMAGLGTSTLPGATALYLPLVASRGTLGVLGVRPADPGQFEAPEQLHQIETFANQTALALERARLAEEAQEAEVRVQGERLRNSLLSSVSHDLRTPLAAITGAASTLIDAEDRLDASTRRELLETVHEEADRLNRLVQNLLEMTRLESGAIRLRKEWHALEEVVGSVLGRFSRGLKDRPVLTRLPADLPLVPMDDVLVEQVLINLIDNAIKHTPAGSTIEISAWTGQDAAGGEGVFVKVADRGPGLAPGDEERVFDKFYRGSTGSGRGVGLGLAICDAIVRAHGGRIWAETRPDGGAAFRFMLPMSEKSPVVSADVAPRIPGDA